MSQRPQRLAVLCAGQGEHTSLDFADLRPVGGDCDQAHRLWEAACAQVGGDWQLHWAALSPLERAANLQAQRAVVLAQGLRWLRLRASLPPPDWVLGYSVGELSAHAIAGSLPWAALPGLASARARAMDAAAAQLAGGLLPAGPCLVRVGGPLPPAAAARRLKALARHGLLLAIRRGPRDAVWGGSPQAVAQLQADPEAAHWLLRAIDVRCPAHTAHLSAALPDWSAALVAAPLQAPRCGVLAGISAVPLRDAEGVQSALLHQVAQPILWDACLAALIEHGVTRILDLGPGQDQSRLVREQLPAVTLIEPPPQAGT